MRDKEPIGNWLFCLPIGTSRLNTLLRVDMEVDRGPR